MTENTDPMNCFACERNLSAYVDDELSREVRLELEAHLDSCDACRQEYETQLAAGEAAADLPVPAAPGGLWEALESEIQAKAPSPTAEDLALIVRGLAGEVRELRQAVESLRSELEAVAEEEPMGESERVRRFHRLRVWSETPSRAESAG